MKNNKVFPLFLTWIGQSLQIVSTVNTNKILNQVIILNVSTNKMELK